MSTFAPDLDRLLLLLRTVPSSSLSASAHLQRLAVRIERAYAQLRAAGTPAPAELFIRLRGRIEELADGVDEAHAAGLDTGTSLPWDSLREDTRRVLRSLEQLLASSPGACTPASTSHSRTPSADLPRRTPSAHQPATSPSVDLDAFLSSSSTTRPPAPATDAVSPLAAARACALSEAYILFQLATTPSTILPPGETLRNVFKSSRASTSEALTTDDSLEGRISSQMHQAYFDSFMSTFSSPSPASSFEQLAAWSRLAQDLVDAVLPLVPSRLKAPDGGPLRAHLAATILVPETESEGTFDPRSALEGVRQAVRALGRLCAPARDNTVRLLAADIDLALANASGAGQSALVDLVRRMLELARGMDADVKRFRAGVVGELAREEELQEVVREEAGARERRCIEEWFGGAEGVRRETHAWCARSDGGSVPEHADPEAGPSKAAVAATLVDALFSSEPVALPPFSASTDADAPPPPNLLPPILLVLSPALFTLQNRLQALTILACLLLFSPSPAAVADPARLWTLLESELPPSPGRTPAASDEPTRLEHLAAELLPRSPAPAPGEAQRMQEAVARVLRYEDPVWRLLHGRLRDAVRTAVVHAVEGTAEVVPDNEGRDVPAVLRTGRGREQRAAPEPEPERARAGAQVDLPPVKGFDRAPLLAEKLREAVQDRLVGEVWTWVEDVWGTALGWKKEQRAAEGVAGT